MSLIPIMSPVGVRYSIENLTLVRTKSYGAEAQFALGWNENGTKLYGARPTVWADATRPWDVSSLGAMVARATEGPGEDYPANTFSGFGVGYNADGTKIYGATNIAGGTTDGVEVEEYTLSSPYDPTSNGAVVANAQIAGSVTTNGRVQAAWFSSDGTRLIWAHTGDSGNVTRMYYATMSTPFSASSLGTGSLFATYSLGECYPRKGQGDSTFILIDETSGVSTREYTINSSGDPGAPVLKSSTNLNSGNTGTDKTGFYGRFGERFFVCAHDGSDTLIREYAVG